MDAMTASAILADHCAARGLSVSERDDGALIVNNPLHPRVGEVLTAQRGRYLTDYGYEIGEHGDEPATADRLVFLLGLPCVPRQPTARTAEAAA
ncbi:hypothetical protein [Streptomyces thermodiastaticus]|jgi:hypothetical protein|uniref:hypothetical protein n=1 Tax=Streptomyces thermodiastaticus TaxID=44061 RepID=UPI001677041D|nr:hypothetical protein [Streptomyces thermodiastaticus]MCE7548581.1 hypothetical protein [Streptomyces thermodiastaticus]GHF81840.1 hypothetical protein GCM10018787_33300 [Streptomyces thermodiastaticus]